MLVMLGMGMFRLGDRSLKLDETTSFFLTQVNWSRFLEIVADSKANMSLYFAALRIWPFHGDEIGLRSLSVLFGVLMVLPLVAIARRFLPDILAIAAAVMLAAHPLFFAELRDARAYSLAMLLCVTGTWLLLLALEAPRSWPWIAYGGVMALALYAHFLTGFVVLAHLVLLATMRFPIRRAAALIAIAVIAVAAVPVAAVALVQGGNTLRGVDPPTWESVLGAFAAAAGSEAAVGIYAVGLAMGAVLWLGARGGTLARGPAWQASYLAGVLTFSLIAIVSLAKPILVDRYVVIAVPFMILGVIGVGYAISAKLAAVIVAVLFLASGIGTYAQLTAATERPAAWVQHIISSAEPGDGVLFDDKQDRKVLAYYLPEPQASWLEVVGSRHPITTNPYEEHAPAEQPVGFRQVLRAMPCRYERVWLIGGPKDLSRPRDRRASLIAEALSRSYVQTYGERYGNLWVRLFERKPAAAC